MELQVCLIIGRRHFRGRPSPLPNRGPRPCERDGLIVKEEGNHGDGSVPHVWNLGLRRHELRPVRYPGLGSEARGHSAGLCSESFAHDSEADLPLMWDRQQRGPGSQASLDVW
jgi:hypothetical protein